MTVACSAGEPKYWGEWSEWGGCSESTCGEGLSTRSRSCLGCTGTCDGSDIESRPCTAGDPKSWSEWGVPYGCSKVCGVGTAMRSRTCSVGCHGSCDGSATETVACRAGSNLALVFMCLILVGDVREWATWEAWSRCTVSCGPGGLRIRERGCDGCLDECIGSNSVIEPCNEDVPCRLFCSLSIFVAYVMAQQSTVLLATTRRCHAAAHVAAPLDSASG